MYLSFGNASRRRTWERIAKDIGAEFRPETLLDRDTFRYQEGPWEIVMDAVTRRQVGGNTGLIGSDSSREYTITRLRAPFVNVDNFRFTVYKQDTLASMGKWFGMQDVVVGDEIFDRNFIVKSNNEERVKTLLDCDRVRRLIKRQPDVQFELRGDDGLFRDKFPMGVDQLYVELHKNVVTRRRIEMLFDLFCTTLDRLTKMDSGYEDDPEVVL